MLAKAIAITAEAFKNKLDKGGRPYILHCLRVMNAVMAMDSDDEDLHCVAVMHDLIEDCSEWNYDRLRAEGFSDDIIFLLSIITHDDPEMSYDIYIKRISLSKECTMIKLADLRDNSDITRMKGLRKKDFERLEKYHKAYMYLKD